MKYRGKINKRKTTKVLSLLFSFILCLSLIGSGFITNITQADGSNTLTATEDSKIDESTMNPGDVEVRKWAEAVSGKVNTWKITLLLEAKDAEETSDIVLVIDRSGSMQDSQNNNANRMTKAKEAARNFVDTVIDADSQGTRIAIVSFAGESTTNQGFTNSKTALKSVINSLNANGGTYTQDGLNRARNLLSGSTATHKTIVLLSDGEPTYSARINNPTNYLSMQYIGSYSSASSGGLHQYNRNGYATTTGVPANQYTYGTNGRIGKGFAMFHYFGDYQGTPYFYNHGNSTIAEGGFAKSSGYVIYSVGLSVNATGRSVLQNTASTNKYYDSDESGLNAVFQNIAGSIASAMKSATVSDPMGDGFEIPTGANDIYVSQGTINYDENTRKLSWNIGDLTNDIYQNGVNTKVKYAKMTYTIEINDGILNAPTADGKLFQTNKETIVTYTDIHGNVVQKYFEVPSVDPILLVVEKKVYDKNGNEVVDTAKTGNVYKIRVRSNEGYNVLYELHAGERKVMTNLRLEDHYTVVEEQIVDSNGNEVAKTDYESNINVYGNDVSDFQIKQGDPDSPILVTNREKPGLVISKTVSGNMGDKEKAFLINISLKDKNGNSISGTFNYTSTTLGNGTITFTNGKGQISLKHGQQVYIEKLPIGTQYEVSEDATVAQEGYTITYSSDDNTSTGTGKLIVASADTTGDDTVSITNDKTINTPTGVKIDPTSHSIWIGGGMLLMVAVFFKKRKRIND